MIYKLNESKSEDNEIIFDFIGFEDWKDFVSIMEVIQDLIKADKSEYKGITDMNGYFEKEGLTVGVEYSSMLGNCLVYKGEQTEEALSKLRSWSKMIFDALMKNV